MNMESHFYDVVIIGAGPGGLSAAVYTSRANMKTLILDRGVPGGQLQNTEEVENYPGYKHITGPELAQQLFEHSTQFGAEYKYGEVIGLLPLGDGKVRVKTSSGIAYIAKSVIVATGTKYKRLGIPGEDKLSGKGISWCAVCDGAFFKERHVVVVGGGDSAVEEAMYLTKFASKVTIVHRRDKFRAQPILVDRMMKNEKIEVIYNAVVEEILGDNKVSGVVLKDTDGNITELICDGVFEYIGMNPVSEFVGSLPIKDEEGWIITNANMETSVPGIYAIGDIRKDSIRQIVSAAGDGSVAAIKAQQYVEMIE